MGEEHLKWSHAMICCLGIPDLDIRPRLNVQMGFVSLEIGFIPSSYNQSCLNHLHSILKRFPLSRMCTHTLHRLLESGYPGPT